jgi:hypothetical protein
VDDELSNWNVPDSSPAVELFGSGDLHFPVDLDSQFEPLDTLSGKLKTYCPTLFESLTSWEREAVDSSGWLKRSTTSKLSPRVVDKSLEASLFNQCFSQEPVSGINHL